MISLPFNWKKVDDPWTPSFVLFNPFCGKLATVYQEPVSQRWRYHIYRVLYGDLISPTSYATEEEAIEHVERYFTDKSI